MCAWNKTNKQTKNTLNARMPASMFQGWDCSETRGVPYQGTCTTLTVNVSEFHALVLHSPQLGPGYVMYIKWFLYYLILRHFFCSDSIFNDNCRCKKLPWMYVCIFNIWEKRTQMCHLLQRVFEGTNKYGHQILSLKWWNIYFWYKLQGNRFIPGHGRKIWPHIIIDKAMYK